MPRLACWNCGHRVYATPAIGSLFLEERRCPGCGARMNLERRFVERREQVRRRNPPDVPGPPLATGERRVAERRLAIRRRPG